MDKRDEMIEEVKNIILKSLTASGENNTLALCTATILVDKGVRTANGFHATECICPDEGDCNPIIKPINYSEVDK